MEIQQLTLHTANPAVLQAFYGQQLGLDTPVATSERLEVQAGATRLIFQQAPTGWQGYYHFAFNIGRGAWEATRRWAQENFQLIADQHGTTEFQHTGWNAVAVYFYDPAGNILELIERRDLPDGAGQAIPGTRVISVSEIGLVTPHVTALAAEAQAHLGAAPFRGSSGETFAALGDELGLLIIVQEGREWYPDTGQKAAAAPLDILARSHGRHYTISGPPYHFLPVDL